MNPSTTLKFFCLFFSLLITLAAVSAAPYSDYDRNYCLFSLIISPVVHNYTSKEILGHVVIAGNTRIYTKLPGNTIYVVFISFVVNPGNVNELFDMLMQRENMDDNLGMHQVVRKSRGPQLRLRFGKRYEHPYLRLRFGKREDSSVPVSAYMAGVSSEADN